MNIVFRNKLFFFLVLFLSEGVYAQLQQTLFADLGKNNLSEKWSMQLGSESNYKIADWNFNLLLQTNLISEQERDFIGYGLEVGKQVLIKEKTFTFSAFHQEKYLSKELLENNSGVKMSFSHKQADFIFGGNYRVISYTKKTIEERGYAPGENTRIIETGNLMYRLGYWLKPRENNWNVSGYLTNYNFLLIEQETNPMVYLNTQFSTAKGPKLFAQLWYTSAGFFNIQVNYFGVLFRTGVTWQF